MKRNTVLCLALLLAVLPCLAVSAAEISVEANAWLSNNTIFEDDITGPVNFYGLGLGYDLGQLELAGSYAIGKGSEYTGPAGGSTYDFTKLNAEARYEIMEPLALTAGFEQLGAEYNEGGPGAGEPTSISSLYLGLSAESELADSISIFGSLRYAPWARASYGEESTTPVAVKIMYEGPGDGNTENGTMTGYEAGVTYSAGTLNISAGYRSAIYNVTNFSRDSIDFSGFFASINMTF